MPKVAVTRSARENQRPRFPDDLKSIVTNCLQCGASVIWARDARPSSTGVKAVEVAPAGERGNVAFQRELGEECGARPLAYEMNATTSYRWHVCPVPSHTGAARPRKVRT